MTITEAQAVLQHAVDDLSAMLAAKGYPRAHAEIWIGRDTFEAVVVIDHAPGSPIPPVDYIRRDRRADVALDNARREIAKLPDPHAMDPWFDFSHPMNQTPKAA